MTLEFDLEAGKIGECVFTIEATLMTLAGPDDSMDRFVVKLTEETYGAIIVTDWMQGIGHREYNRRNRGDSGRPWARTDYDRLMHSHKLLPEGWKRLNDCSKPKTPSVADVLNAVFRDASDHQNLIDSGEHPLDYIMSEFGYEKPSEAERIVNALREQANKLRQLLRNTGLTMGDLETVFADY